MMGCDYMMNGSMGGWIWIAARRFARGDINKDDYETLRATLSR